MPHATTSEPASDPSRSSRDVELEELERRIETLESLDESEFGEFTRRDWVVCVLGALVIPALVLLWLGR
jgi:hypothetical protein